MPNVTVDVDIEVWCSCGSGLCNQTDGGNGCVTVEPCSHCLEQAREDGRDDGYSDGEQTGYERGYDDGYEAGQKDYEN